MKRLSDRFIVGGYFVFWTFYFSFFWLRSIFKDAQGNLIVGSVNMWGDWAIHFTMGSAMAFRDLLPLESPLLIGAPFRYPFFVNWLSALFIRMGFPFFESFTIPSLLFCLFSIYALYVFFNTLLKSPGWAVLASCLFLFNGGWGIVEFIKDIAESATPLKTLILPPQKYTRMDSLHIHWISVIDSMLIPQRSFQLGLPMGLFVLRNLIEPTPRRLWVAGILMGLLPVVHAHTFMAIAIVAGAWCVWELIFHMTSLQDPLVKKWATFWGPAVVLAVPLSLFYVLPGSSGSDISWKPGWYAASKKINWFEFWWLNWGLMPLAALAGLRLVWKDQKKIYLPFFLLFALLNLFLFQRWIWDNTKLLVWASVGFVALAVIFMRRLPKASAAVLVILLGVTGFVDAYRLQRLRLNRYQMYTAEDLRIADWVKKNTKPNSVWITGPYHNNALFNLTGRRVLLTYEGWVWTHGYDYGDVRKDLYELLERPSNPNLLRKYKVDYALIGPSELGEYKANEAAFEEQFTLVAGGEKSRIYAMPTGAHNFGKTMAANTQLPAQAASDDKWEPGLRLKQFKNTVFVGSFAESTVPQVTEFEYSSSDPKPFQAPSSLIYEGGLNVPTDGVYDFLLESDDGTWLWIDDQLVIDNGGRHGVQRKENRIQLEKGAHTFRLNYFDAGGGAILSLKWRPPGSTEFQDIPPATWIRPQS